MNLLLPYIIYQLMLVFQVMSEQKIAITADVLENYLNGSVHTTTKTFPWHVAVLRHTEKGATFLCSGTVIINEFVITSAKCVVPVPTRDLRVLVSQANLHKFQRLENQSEIFRVKNKYYHYHSGMILEKGLSVLRLQELSTLTTTQLATLPSTYVLSKHCFTLGWGIPKKTALDKQCSKLGIQDMISGILKYKRKNYHLLNSVLSTRNIMGLSSMFILKIGHLFNFPSLVHSEYFGENSLREGVCQADEYSHREKRYLSAIHHYTCLCPDRSHLCLYNRRSEYLGKKVDIGSPIFCKIKPGKTEKNHEYEIVPHQYVLSGIFTNNELEKTTTHKYNSSFNIMKATRVDNYPNFLFALMRRRN